MTAAREQFPTCHALAVLPEPVVSMRGRESGRWRGQVGYRVRDLACEDCPVKFSCLPASIHKGISDAKLEQDGEVDAFVGKRVSLEYVMQRVSERQAIRARGERVPYDLHPRVRILSESVIASEPRWKVLRRGRPWYHSVRVESQGVYRQYSASDFPLPLPRKITRKQMERRLAKTNIGQLAPLTIGMAVHRDIERGPLAGTTLIVAFRESGFETDGCLFGSLSSAVTHHLGYNRTGRAFINLARPHTRLYDAQGKQIQ